MVEEYDNTVAIIKGLNQENHVLSYSPYYQRFSNLLGNSDNPCDLIGKYIDNEKSHLEKIEENLYAVTLFYLNKMILSYLFQEYSVGKEYSNEAKSALEAVLGMLHYAWFYFYDSLIHLGGYNSSSRKEQKKSLKRVNENQKKMKLWAKHAPMNYRNKYLLIEAEKACVFGISEGTGELYDQAISQSKESELRDEEAIANECAGRFYISINDREKGKEYLEKAYNVFKWWGAKAKLKHMEATYPDFLKPVADPILDFKVNRLDFDSVLKASHTISAEMSLNNLLEKVMAIVIENAGAQKGLLLLEKDRQWFIEAEMAVGSSKVNILHSLPLDGELVCRDIVQYVIKTRENVVLDNA